METVLQEHRLLLSVLSDAVDISFISLNHNNLRYTVIYFLGHELNLTLFWVLFFEIICANYKNEQVGADYFYLCLKTYVRTLEFFSKNVKITKQKILWCGRTIFLVPIENLVLWGQMAKNDDFATSSTKYRFDPNRICFNDDSEDSKNVYQKSTKSRFEL